MTDHKYTLRKLGFFLVVALLIASPFVARAYRSATTTDPYILMAREIEAFSPGEVDVVDVEDHPTVEAGLTVFVVIENYPEWSERGSRENFKRYVLQVARDYNYEALLLLLGWDYPAAQMRIQGVIFCDQLTASSCTWESVPGQSLPPEFIKWPGIGKP